MSERRGYNGKEMRAAAQVLRHLRKMSESDLRGAPDDYWHIDGLVCLEYYPFSYDAAFRDLLGGRRIADLLKVRKREGKSSHVLDLFGGAYLIGPGELKYMDSLTGVRMRSVDRFITDEPTTDVQMNIPPLMREWARDISAFPRRRVIEGNLYTREAWRQVGKRMWDVTAGGYDMILCKPVGGFSFMRSDSPWEQKRNVLDPYETEDIAHTFTFLLQRAVRVLAPDGVMMTEVPDVLSDWICQTVKEQESVCLLPGMDALTVRRGYYELNNGEVRHVLRLNRESKQR